MKHEKRVKRKLNSDNHDVISFCFTLLLPSLFSENAHHDLLICQTRFKVEKYTLSPDHRYFLLVHDITSRNTYSIRAKFKIYDTKNSYIFPLNTSSHDHHNYHTSSHNHGSSSSSSSSGSPSSSALFSPHDFGEYDLQHVEWGPRGSQMVCILILMSLFFDITFGGVSLSLPLSFDIRSFQPWFPVSSILLHPFKYPEMISFGKCNLIVISTHIRIIFFLLRKPHFLMSHHHDSLFSILILILMILTDS